MTLLKEECQAPAAAPRDGEDLLASTLQIRSLPLFFATLGSENAYPVLFLHGITGSHRYWRRKAAPLARRFRLILPDLPGFGRSPKPDVRYTPEFYREALRGLLVRLGLGCGPLSIVGHSLGSIIAAEYAARYPRGIERLVLLSTPRYLDSDLAHRIYWLGSPSYRKLLGQDSVRENLAQAHRLGWKLTLRSFWSMPLAAVADCRKFTLRSLTSTIEHCLLRYRIDPVLPRIEQVPVLMIHGGRDQVAPFGHIQPLPAMYRNIRLVMLRSSGHHVFLTDTRQVRRLITGFMDNGHG
ncbi:MAG: alpha/beta hydrolase [Acidobacteriota bacterium]